MTTPHIAIGSAVGFTGERLVGAVGDQYVGRIVDLRDPSGVLEALVRPLLHHNRLGDGEIRDVSASAQWAQWCDVDDLTEPASFFGPVPPS